ncbi:MAG TPA: hypothetical protein VNL91_09220 [Thermoanaerobaculia bacterium]|nr:hypothetical protein [Thermoanaerobaculia bacterium]
MCSIAAALLCTSSLVAGESDWGSRVSAAKAIADAGERTDAMLQLVREALAPHEVRLSGTKHPDHVHPEDNEAAPVINFDPRLQEKRSAPSRSGGATRSLRNNFGYYFSRDGRGYVVLGPAALDSRSPIFTVLAAEHELFHALHHVGDPRPLEDRELEAWSEMFVRYFHQVHPFRQRWAPMLAYYEEAAKEERKKAIERLAAYYRDPPSSSEEADSGLREAFRNWFEQRKTSDGSSMLVRDLEAALPAM